MRPRCGWRAQSLATACVRQVFVLSWNDLERYRRLPRQTDDGSRPKYRIRVSRFRPRNQRAAAVWRGNGDCVVNIRSGLKNTRGSGSCGRFPWERRPAAIHYLIAPRWRCHGGRFKANQLFETPSSVFCRHTFATPLQKMARWSRSSRRTVITGKSNTRLPSPGIQQCTRNELF